MKVLDLFSGIGGFSLGFESTGYFQTTKFVEMDKYCQKILRKNFPGIKIEEDIRNVKGQEYEADVITGGFPCQPFSVAGRQKGTSDDRYLWPEMFRLIKEIKPKWVVGENVSGLINLQDGMVLRQVQDDLEGEGFEVQCFIIPASGIGAWHQRKRVWIVAHANSRQCLRSKEQIQAGRNTFNTSSEDVAHAESFGRREPRDINQTQGSQESISTQSNGSSENVSDSKGMRSGGRSSQECGPEQRKLQQIKQEGSSLRSEIEGCRTQNVSNTESLRTQRLWTFREQEPATYGEEELSLRQSQNSGKSWWEIESNLCGVPDGLSYELDKARAPRIKALGNSIVPQIAKQIALSIIHAEEGK